MNLFYLSVVAAILALDTAAALQILISQPIIACTLLGWLGGNPELGLHIGFLFQLIWLSSLPVGAAIVPEGNSGALIGTIVALNLSQFDAAAGNMLILAVVAYALGLSYIGAYLVKLIRTSNIFFLNRMLAFLERGASARLGVINMAALLYHFCLMLMFVLITSYSGVILIQSALNHIPAGWNTTARFVEIALLGAGAGLTLNLYNRKRYALIVAAGCIFGALAFYF